jgi:sugar lactone lactonase YvrE
VLKFAADGTFLFEWGSKGTGPGQFDLPHGLAQDGSGRVFVVDRRNARVQLFDRDGKYLAQWRTPTEPSDR